MAQLQGPSRPAIINEEGGQEHPAEWGALPPNLGAAAGVHPAPITILGPRGGACVIGVSSGSMQQALGGGAPWQEADQPPPPSNNNKKASPR